MPPISYSKGFATWADKPSTATPTSATKYNNFETGISQLYEIYDAAGDLAVGSGADTLDRLAAPTTNDHVLVADTTQTLKMKWAAVPGVAGAVLATLVDAKGDLLVGTAADTVARKAVGTNEHVLVADSAQSDGMVWKQIDNDSIAAAAAIDQSKLSFTAWTTFTPTWASSGTAPAIGNGTLTGRYMQIGDLVVAGIRCALGSTSTVGTGNYTWALPVTADTSGVSTFGTIGFGRFFDNSVSDHWTLAVNLSGSSSVVQALYTNVDGVVVGAAAPVVPANGDTYLFTVIYEAA